MPSATVTKRRTNKRRSSTKTRRKNVRPSYITVNVETVKPGRKKRVALNDEKKRYAACLYYVLITQSTVQIGSEEAKAFVARKLNVVPLTVWHAYKKFQNRLKRGTIDPMDHI